MSTVELALPARAELGEGARWDERTGTLFWVDILRGRVHQFSPADRGLPELDRRPGGGGPRRP
jgi:sugar lactone lactonase YvrE